MGTQGRELATILSDLPAERGQELLDFARFLHQRYVVRRERSTANAIAKALHEQGGLEFEEGELELLLKEIESLRELDLTIDG